MESEEFCNLKIIQGLPGQDGQQGPKGDKGDRGLPGQDGQQGPKGDKGDRGLPGQDGQQGPKGDKGDRGLPGQDGQQGPKGDKGDRGLQGPPGINGTDGIGGTSSNQCNDCLLFGLFELDSATVVLDANITLPIVGETTIPIALNNRTIDLLLEQLKVQFNLPDTSNIFDICSSIDASFEEGTIETDIENVLTAIGIQLIFETNEKISDEIILFLNLLGLSEEEIQIALPSILIDTNAPELVSNTKGNIEFVLVSIIECITSNQ